MPRRLPIPIRFHLAVHRTTLVLERLARELLSTVAWSFTPAAGRDEVTAAMYARRPTYLRGGSAFEGGLFQWELDAFARPEWPGTGKVLVAGAGGGRELRILAGQGHAVRGFEPLPLFASACAKECSALPDATCLEGSYADLLMAVRDGTGPLASLVAEAPFDAVLLGWGSLAHLTEPAQVEAVLDATRKIAPGAPVCTSFYTPETTGTGAGRVERLGVSLGRLFSLIGAPGRRPEGGVFVPSAGFVQTHTPGEIRALAARHGYGVASISTTLPQAWALLVPVDGPPTT